jgi:hypothetical protein
LWRSKSLIHSQQWRWQCRSGGGGVVAVVVVVVVVVVFVIAKVQVVHSQSATAVAVAIRTINIGYFEGCARAVNVTMESARTVTTFVILGGIGS